MGKLPPGYTVTKIRHIDPNKWYAIDLRNARKLHILPLSMDNFHLAKRWLISQKFYLANQVQLIKGNRALESGIQIKWDNLPLLALPHKYPGHTGFGNSRKDWKEAIRKELKASEDGWNKIRQYTFFIYGDQYVIYSWDKDRSNHVKRILTRLFDKEQIKKIKKRMHEGPKKPRKTFRWISGYQRNPSPIMINRFNKEHGLPPLDRFPWDGNIAMRWRGFIEEHAPLAPEYLEPIL